MSFLKLYFKKKRGLKRKNKRRLSYKKNWRFFICAHLNCWNCFQSPVNHDFLFSCHYFNWFGRYYCILWLLLHVIMGSFISHLYCILCVYWLKLWEIISPFALTLERIIVSMRLIGVLDGDGSQLVLCPFGMSLSSEGFRSELL